MNSRMVRIPVKAMAVTSGLTVRKATTSVDRLIVAGGCWHGLAWWADDEHTAVESDRTGAELIAAAKSGGSE